MAVYPEIKLNIKLDIITENSEINRNNLRKLAITEFSKERAGTGKGELATNYKYIVETLKSGERVYITRPAFNKMGFDFLIHVENYKFSNGRDNPKHEDLIEDIKLKIENKNGLNKILLSDLEKIYSCHEPNEETIDYDTYSNLPGFPIDLILKTSKWFFIEQDIRYWNYSGRNMLMESYKDKLNKIV